MADSKITALTSISTSTDPANDPLVIVDVSDTSMAATGTTKKVTLNQLLGASGTATLASATITGNLTVNGSYISCGNNSYIRTDAANLFSIQTGSLGFRIMNAGNSALFYGIDSASTSTWYDGAGGTRMTLNSTGLGIGLAPVGGVKLSVAGTIYANAGNALILDNPSSNFVAQIKNTGSSLQSTLAFLTGSGTSMLIDNSGNVGIGVTPSAWASGNKFIDINSSAAFGAFGSSDAMMIGNAYWNGSSWIRKTANNAWRFVIESVSSTPTMTWQLAANGSAGSSITWTQAMTLDASGRLGVGVVPASNTRTHFKGSSTSTDYINYCVNSSDKLAFGIRNDGLMITGPSVDSATLPNSPYNLTSGSAANVFVDSQGIFYRSTSSLKYKTDIADSTRGLADVLKLRPVTYKAKNSGDTVFGGLIAEEVDAAGLTEFVQYAPDNTPDAIHYGNMVSLLVAAIKELTARVQTLETR